MQEIWLPISGYEGFYEVSNFGNVRSIRRQTRCVSKAGLEFTKPQGGGNLKHVKHNAGYLSVVLSAKGNRSGKLIHRLVADAFVENISDLPWVNHKDANKHNNQSSNLEWCTASENYQHASLLGLFPTLRGTQRPSAKLNDEKVHIIKKMMLIGFTNIKLAEIFNVSTAPISYIRSGKAWTHIPW